ncbi:MAG TPA: FG-GAP-like repeat-containing protein [Kofleriaceae bacterium]|jgi:hypothetical protein|nr:FG-GAP-like repeat-containing protein [Kofleriaceae bacterium]
MTGTPWNRYKLLWVISGALTAGACAAQDLNRELPTGTRESSVIFGSDDRLEYRDSSALEQQFANSVALLTLTKDLTCNTSFCTMTQVTTATPLCAGERFANQSVDGSGFCTAFMIGPRTFATAGHCIAGDEVLQFPAGPFPSSGPQPRRCAAVSPLFFWKIDSPNTVNANFHIDLNHVYHCTRVIEHGAFYGPLNALGIPSNVSAAEDWAIFEVERDVIPTTGNGPRTPLAFSRDPTVEVGLNVTTIGHPVGLPVKISSGSSIQASPSATGDFSYDGDTMVGNSGSPVIDEPSGIVRGVFTSGPIELEGSNSCLRNLHCPGDADCIDELSGKPDFDQGSTLSRVTRFFAADLDQNGSTDYVTLAPENGFWTLRVDSPSVSLAPRGLAPLSSTLIPLAPQIAVDDSAMLALGDFDHDGITDVAALVNGVVFSVRIAPGATALQSFTAPASDYTSIQVVDVDGDGVDDLVATRRDGSHQSFHGGSSGLGAAQDLSSLRGPDFDGDGKEDIAIAAPARVVTGGRVNVIFGDSSKPGKVLDNVLGSNAALAWGDFDGDGRDELVASAPSATIDGVARTGELTVIGWTGSDLAVKDRLHRKDFAKAGIVAGRNDFWGGALATGDFDGDGTDDLVVGEGFPELFGVVRDHPASVIALYGKAGVGLTDVQSFVESDFKLESSGSEVGVGWALATGDFNCDGVDDVAIGAPGARINGVDNAGAVAIIYGARGSGLDLDTLSILTEPSFGDGHATFSFGNSLASGNFNGDSQNGRACVDLVIGSRAAWETGVGSRTAVSVVQGSPTGLRARSRQYFQAGVDQIPDQADYRYRFGQTMTVARANGDGFDDLVVGAIGKGAGSILIFTGSASGLSAAPSIWRQGQSPIPDTPEQTERYTIPYLGIGAGDFFSRGLGGTSNGLLVVGAPYEGFDATAPATTWTEGAGWAGLLRMGSGSAVEITDVREYGQSSAIFGSHDASLANFGWSITQPRAALLPRPAAPLFPLAAFPASDFVEPASGSSLGEASDPLGPWTSPQTSISVDTAQSTVGGASLKLSGSGYMVATSSRLGTASFDPVGDVLSLDVFLPGRVDWGTAEIYATVPGAGINNSQLGLRELRTLPGAQWSTLAFPVSDSLRQVFLGDHANAQLSIVINTPVAGVQLDNLRFTGNLVPRTIFHGTALNSHTIATNRVLSFDHANTWSSPQVALFSETEASTEGSASLGIPASGWTELNSAPFSTSSLRPASGIFGVDLFVPGSQPNPSWVGDLQIYLTCPSTTLSNRLIGQQSLTSTFWGEFNPLSFPLPPDVQAVLSGDHADCTARVTLNVNPDAGIWMLDNMGFVQP